MAEDHPHRRYNPLSDTWVLVSPHRSKRPWQGQHEDVPDMQNASYDASCYLCPGNKRANGTCNPHYSGTYVFDNDFPALLPDTVRATDTHHLLQTSPVQGTCRVLCFSPRHDLTLAEMSTVEIEAVVTSWTEQMVELGQIYRWVQIFENKGSVMGCSNPHPHGQIWATDTTPHEPAQEARTQQEYYREHNTPLLLDYAGLELDRQERIVVENAHWLAVIPYWAVWPFEVLLLPRRHVLRLPDLSPEERESLAHILKRLLVSYDNLFESAFPYSMGWHGAPMDEGSDFSHWQLHAHFYPPLLRSATVQKFMVGYEMLAEPQRDLTPEQAAERLRALPSTHFRDSGS